MSDHIDVSTNHRDVPWYAVHKDGIIAGFFGDFSFLSNFYVLKNGVWFEELCFPSVEHAYQAAKWPIQNRSHFVGVSSGKARKLGKLAPNFNRKRWEKIKYDVMYELVSQKFHNNGDVAKKLLLTEGYQLEERNSWGDQYWGTNEKGEGENNLGKILMIVRDVLKQEYKV